MMMMNNRIFVILFAFIASYAVAQPGIANVSPPGAIPISWFDTGPIVAGQRPTAPVRLTRGSRLWFETNNLPLGRNAAQQLWIFENQQAWRDCNFNLARQLAGPPNFNTMPVSVTFLNAGRYFLAGGTQECLANAKVIVTVKA